MGMTGKAPDAPRKRRRASSILAFSTGTSRKGQRSASGRRQTGFESLCPDSQAFSGAASIVVMLRTLNPQSAVRFPGGVRAGNANPGKLASSNLAVCRFESGPAYRFRVGCRQPSMALNHAPVGSTPAPEAMPPRTAAAPPSYRG